ncbi:hypothetical protein ACFVIL_39355 [Streptomyces sp. NPDC127159]|uniref:hypothetical protein n=1 Tax=unclassified Streptomyces TaxID=2593676 RepID=UPI0034223CE5
MTLTTHALIPALQDARDAHAAVIDRFRADMAVTPVGPHRRAMEHHLADAHEYMTRIDEHVRAIRPRHLLSDTTAIVRTLVTGAFRAARIPMEAGAMIVDGLLYGGQPAAERRLLKNIEGEYAATAQALAACRVGESIAALADDERAMDLLGALRHQDEQLLQTLENSLEQVAQAMVDATAGSSRQLQGHTMDHAVAGRRAQLWPDSPRTDSRAEPANTPRPVAPAAWTRSVPPGRDRMGNIG